MIESEQTTSVSQVFEQFLTPPRKSPSAKEQKLIEQAEIFSIPSKIADLTAYSWGEGATVLIVHGWGGRGTQFGSFVKPLVDSGYRVLAFDAPAHGKTVGKQTNGFELAEAIATIAAKESPIDTIIAHSLGATSTALALSKEVFARKVVCLASLCWLSSSVKRFAKLAKLSQQAEDELYRLMENKFGKDVWDIVSVDKRVANLSIPALLFHDRADRDCSLRESEAISQAWQNSQLIVTEGLGHNRILRDEQVVQQTVNFIKEQNI
ncbi:putative hydrolase or acyltransferase of alpha/beta superfamily [Hyella patelloides LEGE 07179]|uniref:Putative hydrolase or acyltransferase of alpha/beta superfamily n=1 Tax=Hyella patelloides LEGE 07179 TaxID=945734 RepID=A0A563VJZ2_9CYAN|nr:alpha/beta fold hydrolase [Hyella patelloides]VEP11605.1 putative hydrolase or acyltransferase of alpha/beta superfamily [Hyella patelloides LEGE 07179]